MSDSHAPDSGVIATQTAGEPEIGAPVQRLQPKSYSHLASRIFGRVHAIRPEKLDEILSYLGPRFEGQEDAGSIGAYGPGDPKERKPYGVTSEGIAVISVCGTLIKRGGWMSSFSGLTGYDDIRAEVQDALQDTAIKAILLDIDSPGGEVSGCFELVDFLYQSRNLKPIWAVANDNAFSAAYAIASAASKIYTDSYTGGVGSVGVVALHLDQSQWDAKTGLKYTPVFAGARKVDGNPHEPLSDPARETLQAEVDRLYEMFVETVARNRGQSAAKIRDTEAGLFFSDSGIPLLADAKGTMEQALSDLTVHLEQVGLSGAKIAASAQTSSAVASPAGEIGSESTAAVAASNPTEEKTMDQDTLDVLAAAANEASETSAMAEEETSAALPGEMDDEDEEEDDEEEEDEGEQPKKDASGPAKKIAMLCTLAGVPEKAAQYITSGKSVADVQKALLKMRAAKQAPAISSRLGIGSANGSSTFSALTLQAGHAAQKQGITHEQAIERALLTTAGRAAYEHYLAVEHPAFQAIARRNKSRA